MNGTAVNCEIYGFHAVKPRSNVFNDVLSKYSWITKTDNQSEQTSHHITTTNLSNT